MTRETLREAVARALRRAFFDHHFNRASDAGWEDELATADAALTAIEASGWRIVPVEPTEEQIRALLADNEAMSDAFWMANNADVMGIRKRRAQSLITRLTSMLSAAPPATETEKE